MSSDPKGQEPTPLTAEEIAEMADAFADEPERTYILRLAATVAELQREIEGYRQALEKACDWMVSTNDYESLSPAGHAITRDAIATMRRVLAGKEAQG